MSSVRYDTIVVGGGIMGCVVAHRLAKAGQSVALFERGGLCTQASGVNAGTLSIQIKVPDLVPHSIRGWELWKTSGDWLGADLGFRQAGGLAVAFTDVEAERMTARMALRRNHGAPIEIVGLDRAREHEPGLSDAVVLAAWCPLDGYANSYRLGSTMRAALAGAGVSLREFTAVEAITPEVNGYSVMVGGERVEATRLVLAGGVWIDRLLRQLGLGVAIDCRVNQVTVTEKMPPLVRCVISAASGLLTLKQSANGSVLIGGGWQGKGDPDRGGYEVIDEYVIANLRLAAHAIPALRSARVLRTWLGLEASSPDGLPLVGELGGLPNAYVIACVRGGFTIGPCMGQLLADRILGREPELPLFDPMRVLRPVDSVPAAATS